MDSAPPGRTMVTDKPLSSAVVDAIAEAEGVDVMEIDPLYEHIDPEALDKLFQPTPGGDDERVGRVTFRASGYRVEVTSTGRVHLTELDAAEVDE